MLVENIHENARKDVWKGLILGEVLQTLKVKKFVQDIMKEIGLPKNTTLG